MGSAWRRDALIAGILLLVAWLLFALRIDTSIAAGIVDGAVFGSDSAEILTALDDGRYHGVGIRKHPLAVAWAVFTVLPLRLAGLPLQAAAAMSFGLAAAVTLSLLFVIGRMLRLSRAASLALGLLFAAQFSVITVLSVLETIGVTLAAMTASIAAILWAAPRWPPARAGVAAGLAAGVSAWANLPALATAMTALVGKNGETLADKARRFALTLAVAVPVALAPFILVGLIGGFDYQRGVVDTWASVAHFYDPRVLGEYFSSVLGFAAVAPESALTCRYAPGDFAGYVASPVRGAAVVLWLAVVAAGVVIGLRQRPWRWWTISVGAMTAALLIFFLWFAPPAAMLFAPQWQLGLVLLTVPFLAGPTWRVIAAYGLAVLLLAINAPVLPASEIGDLLATCPRELWINGVAF